MAQITLAKALNRQRWRAQATASQMRVQLDEIGHERNGCGERREKAMLNKDGLLARSVFEK